MGKVNRNGFRDLGDLYSNCNRELSEKCMKTAGKIYKLELLDYILKLLRVTMNHSYVKQPKGIFKHYGRQFCC